MSAFAEANQRRSRWINGRIVLQIVVAVAFAAVLFRYTRVLLKTEIGLQGETTNWRNATIGLLGFSYEPVGCRMPAEQADYWLAETERIMSANGVTAEAAIGGAWVLDSPTLDFYARYVRHTGSNFPGFPQLSYELDKETIKTAMNRFETECHERCLELAELSTKMEPNEVEWWRQRALLQFSEGMFIESGPRRADWQDVIEQCSQHDRENALYDYLIASQLIELSTEWNDDNERYELKAKHDLQLADAAGHYARGLKKPFLAFPAGAMDATRQFISRSTLPLAERPNIALSRVIEYRATGLLLQLHRRTDRLVGVAQALGQRVNEISLRERDVRVSDQVLAVNGHVRYDWWARTFARNNAILILELASEDSTRLDEGAMIRWRNRRDDVALQLKLHERAIKEIATRSPAPTPVAGLWPHFLINPCRTTAGLLLPLALISLFVAQRFRRGVVEVGPQMGVTRHLIPWFAGYSLTFLILGLAAAEVVGPRLQSSIAYASVSLVVVLLAVWRLHRFARKRRYRYSLMELLGVVTGACLFFLAWPVIWMAIRDRPELAVPASDFFGVQPEVLRHLLSLKKGSWLWAALQWLAGGGPYAGPLLSLLLLGFWYTRRAARLAEQSTLGYWTENFRVRIGGLLQCLGRSAASVGCLFLLVFLWTAPGVVRDKEKVYQYAKEYLDREVQQRGEVRALIAELGTDPRIVAELRAVIEEEHLAAEENTD
ncbi:MAG: hypothetical protein IID44_16360 [Planctomycetes bacterium]|nr:hypothetical protein [Planctomycetota bacterium]